MNYLLTCNTNSQIYLEQELFHFKPNQIQWLSSEEAIMSTDLSLDEINQIIQDAPIVFLRHIFNIDYEIPQPINEKSFPELALNPKLSFSIQLRSASELRQEANSFRNQWASSLQEQGNTLDVKNPEQVISVYYTSKLVLIGLTPSSKLLSNWSAGAVHFSHHDYFISRAEFKLREVFLIYPNIHGTLAIDLGAAPGGWSYVLAQHGFHVHAIDPAKLDPKVKANDKIQHFPITSQAYLHQPLHQKADVIVNDMKMSAFDSIEIMVSMIPILNRDGVMILTLKMPKDFSYSQVKSCIKEVRKNFTIKTARQLFHNRNEFTLIIKPH